MKDFCESKITIIGFGFLMGYIFPCINAALGEKAAENVIAVTAEKDAVEQKHQEYRIPVLLNDNARALRENQPDYIFFAPPPSVAPGLIEGCLKEYYDQCRAENRELPVLLAFPPSPVGEFYREILGDTVKVVNIIPNMLTQIHGQRIDSEKKNLFTYAEPDNWTEKEKNKLAEFFSPMGGWMNVPRSLIMHVLSSEIMAHPLTELAYDASEALKARGIQISSEQCASLLRVRHIRRRGYATKLGKIGTYPELSTEIVDSLDLLSIAWYQAIKEYLIQRKIEEKEAESFLDPLFDLYFCEAERESRAEIVDKARKDATPGGMLELCLMSYDTVIKPLIWDLLYEGKNAVAVAKYLALAVDNITGAVAEKGNRLAVQEAGIFTPGDHAILFTCFSHAALSLLDQKAAEVFLKNTVISYGRERGQRMAKRAIANGDKLDMAAYYAYGEWDFSGGFRKESIIADHNAYIVRECPWHKAWAEVQQLDKAMYYCDSVDNSILEGFNPELRLEMKSTLTRHDGCEFHWLDSLNDEEEKIRIQQIRSRIGGSCQKDFLYHSAHLASAFMRTAIQQGEEFAADLLEMAYLEYKKYNPYSKGLKVAHNLRLKFTAI